MPPYSIFLKAMRDQRMMIFGFGVGSALMAALVLAVYPSYAEVLTDFEIPPAFQAIIGDIDIGTATGFLTAEFFTWFPLLLMVYAIIQGTGVLAGEETNGTLDLLLAQPLGRTRVFVEKVASIVAGTFLIIALTLPGFLVMYAMIDIDVALDRLMIATIAIAPLVLALAALSLLAGCLLPTRRDAVTVMIAIAVASYFINSLGQAVSVLEPLRPASVFFHYHADRNLVDGVSLAGTGILLAIATVATGIALVRFQRRDIGVVLGSASLAGMLRSIVRQRPASPAQDASD